MHYLVVGISEQSERPGLRLQLDGTSMHVDMRSMLHLRPSGPSSRLGRTSEDWYGLGKFMQSCFILLGYNQSCGCAAEFRSIPLTFPDCLQLVGYGATMSRVCKVQLSLIPRLSVQFAENRQPRIGSS